MLSFCHAAETKSDASPLPARGGQGQAPPVCRASVPERDRRRCPCQTRRPKRPQAGTSPHSPDPKGQDQPSRHPRRPRQFRRPKRPQAGTAFLVAKSKGQDPHRVRRRCPRQPRHAKRAQAWTSPRVAKSKDQNRVSAPLRLKVGRLVYGRLFIRRVAITRPYVIGEDSKTFLHKVLL